MRVRFLQKSFDRVLTCSFSKQNAMVTVNGKKSKCEWGSAWLCSLGMTFSAKFFDIAENYVLFASKTENFRGGLGVGLGT